MIKQDFEIYIPDRRSEGYGPSIRSFQNLINKKGYIYTAGERLDNIASVAVPIFNNKENFTGTLSISGWRQFFTNKSVAKFYKILSGYQNQMKRLVSNE